MDECFGLGGGAADEGSLYESKMASKEADGSGAGLVGAGADAAGPKRSSYEGAAGAADAEADLVLAQADPEGPEDRAADMGAAFPCGRRPKSRASRPWKSSMQGRAAGGSLDLTLKQAGRGASTARRSARGERGGSARRLVDLGSRAGSRRGGTGRDAAIGEMGSGGGGVAGDAAPPGRSPAMEGERLRLERERERERDKHHPLFLFSL
jgi:hypothetical protein